jgi:hypothetical protein
MVMGEVIRLLTQILPLSCLANLRLQSRTNRSSSTRKCSNLSFITVKFYKFNRNGQFDDEKVVEMIEINNPYIITNEDRIYFILSLR